mgnify:CR=1 FL=1
MFTDFFYQLRSYGVKVSLIEWDTFLEALRLGLHQNSFTEFYYLARTTLIKKETDYDRFDQAFTAYFQNLVDLGIIPELLKSGWKSCPRHALQQGRSGPDLEPIYQRGNQ